MAPLTAKTTIRPIVDKMKSRGMLGEDQRDSALTSEEFTELLADATGVDPEDIEQGADELEIESPENAVRVDE